MLECMSQPSHHKQELTALNIIPAHQAHKSFLKPSRLCGKYTTQNENTHSANNLTFTGSLTNTSMPESVIPYASIYNLYVIYLYDIFSPLTPI